MEILGFLCATLVGISLGVFGSGGSILTVPIMVYLLNISPVEATGYSLFVVGLTSSIGGGVYVKKKMVNFKTAAVFGVPSLLSVFLTRKFLMPLIPNPIYSTPSHVLSKDTTIMLLFALLMMIVAYNMIKKAKSEEEIINDLVKYNYLQLAKAGILSGILTGILGVGGGFIIIPALVLYAKISVRMSVGTSLLIIASNSLIGFIQEMADHHNAINYSFLMLFSAFAAAGIFIGLSLSLRLNAAQLKKYFGWLIFALGTGVLFKELVFPVK